MSDTSAPLILAPAGNQASFLAALAAGADAVYCGLKQFSARMEAKNFTLEQLGRLTRLAHEKNTRVYVTINSMLKPDELGKAAGVLENLSRRVQPDGLIIQDLALIRLAREIGFSGKLHVSTLANVGCPGALKTVRTLGVDGVVLPRELTIDEIKAMASACPQDLELEAFVHGALCYGVSGRCYWSSYLGGKSGLRGRCVQPCRRVYTCGKQQGRFFSCQDLSFDVLAKLLLSIPQIRLWKIEGRKKGPHYVYYTVKAYQMLRDHAGDPKMKKAALGLLDQALGRKTTHFNILSQRPQNPVNIEEQTGSGLLMGRVQVGGTKSCFSPRRQLLAGDVLRLGYEDDAGHHVIRMRKSVPKNGRFHLNLPPGKYAAKGTPVFLIDRREKTLDDMLACLQQRLDQLPEISALSTFKSLSVLPRVRRSMPGRSMEMTVYRKIVRAKRQNGQGAWMASDTVKQVPAGTASRLWWWVPPVVWPVEESSCRRLVDTLVNRGCRQFVLNAPWQISLFPASPKIELWAGPFCNTANALAVQALENMGFSGVIVSPELGRDDVTALPRSVRLPLGIVISGSWPLCVSRIIPRDVKPGEPFTSPKGEIFWYQQYDSNAWLYANWRLDLTAKQSELAGAGYRWFVHLEEPVPPRVKFKKRPGLWNWDVGIA